MNKGITPGGPKRRLSPTVFIVLVALSAVKIGLATSILHHPPPSQSLNRTAWAAETSEPDIEWFKQEMGIAEKYREHREGIWGMSWAHFITMVFLVIFFIGALIAVYIRNKRTREILKSLLEEK
jgi:hypothetical protein